MSSNSSATATAAAAPDLPRPSIPRWFRAGIVATAVWIAVASGLIVWNAQAGFPYPAFGLAAGSAVAMLAIAGLVARLKGVDEWSRAGAVMAGVVGLGSAVVALVLVIWRANL